VGFMRMWTLTERVPALWPHLCGATAKLGDISLDPVQEEPFCKNRDSSVSEAEGGTVSYLDYRSHTPYKPTFAAPPARASFPPRKPKAFKR
jgi:hypothetical protein